MPKFLARLSKSLQKNGDAQKEKPSFGVGSMIDGRYRLDAEIGRGGMGIVYRARDISNDCDVAVKVINFELANALTLGQFSREMEIAARLSHPHLVTLHQAGTFTPGAGEPMPFIAMELLRGRSLAETGGLTIARIIDISKQICDFLAYMHDQGFVYRDLKPGNVILERHGFHYFVKMLDLGLARPRGEAYFAMESSLAGTVFYLAPELINGQPADISSDLYALGVTMYEMLTGRVPFSDLDEQNILAQHLEEIAPPPSQSRHGVPPALDAVVLRLLEKDPKDRFASAWDVLEALEQIPPPGEAVKGNLQHGNFHAKEDDVARVRQMLEADQLVTVLGQDDAPALAAGWQLKDQFADGAWLVDVPLVDEPLMLLPTVANILGVRSDGQRSQTVALLGHLREKQLLLILRRCDHLLFACAQLSEIILRSCPDVYILTSSCQPLKVAGEAVIDY